jgi:hypothetical protein
MTVGSPFQPKTPGNYRSATAFILKNLHVQAISDVLGMVNAPRIGAIHRQDATFSIGVIARNRPGSVRLSKFGAFGGLAALVHFQRERPAFHDVPES